MKPMAARPAKLVSQAGQGVVARLATIPRHGLRVSDRTVAGL
jgi:hypothetical protein